MKAILTPVQFVEKIYLKRDDLFEIYGATGGKARTCHYLAKQAKIGLVTAGSRQSPQVALVAKIAKGLNLPCSVHTPSGDITTGPVSEAVRFGADVFQHKPGYNSVIIARAREYAEKYKFTHIPFGMTCNEAVEQTRKQVSNIPQDILKIVAPVGSGMTLAGILWGLIDIKRKIKVTGVMVGAVPQKRLDLFAPPLWRTMVTLIKSDVPYEKHIIGKIGDVSLDPVYEAKCLPYLSSGNLFWIVGHR